MAKNFFYRASVGFARETSLQSSYNTDDFETLRHCQHVINYLVETHGIRISDDFNKSLNEANTKFRKSVLSISTKTLDSIIHCCDMWKEFIDIDDYDKLVCGEVLSMVSFHYSVLSARDFEEKIGISFKKQPSRSFTTIVNNSGKITVYR